MTVYAFVWTWMDKYVMPACIRHANFFVRKSVQSVLNIIGYVKDVYSLNRSGYMTKYFECMKKI